MTLKKVRIKEKLEKLKTEMDKLAVIEKQVLASPDQQLSLTDPDSRSMATSGRGSESLAITCKWRSTRRTTLL